MSTQKRSVLKNWFRKGLIPTQVQFADAFDSFFHKSEDLIPLSQVDGLVTELNNKKYELQEYLNEKLAEALVDLDNSVNDNSNATVSSIDFGYKEGYGLYMDLTMLSGETKRVSLDIPLATLGHDGLMSSNDKATLEDAVENIENLDHRKFAEFDGLTKASVTIEMQSATAPFEAILYSPADGCFVARKGGKYYASFYGYLEYNDQSLKARKDKLFLHKTTHKPWAWNSEEGTLTTFNSEVPDGAIVETMLSEELKHKVNKTDVVIIDYWTTEPPGIMKDWVGKEGVYMYNYETKKLYVSYFDQDYYYREVDLSADAIYVRKEKNIPYIWKSGDMEPIAPEDIPASIFNATNEIPVRGYYVLCDPNNQELSAVHAAWNAGKAVSGLIISFESGTSIWKTFQYIGRTVTESNWLNEANWKDFGSLAAGSESYVDINNLLGNTTVYTLSAALEALKNYMEKTNTDYCKQGMIIAYKSSEKYEVECKQYKGTTKADFWESGLWQDFGGGNVEAESTPVEGSTAPFSTGGAYEHIPTGINVNTETEGVVKVSLRNAAGEQIGDEEQFPVGSGTGGGVASGAVVSIALEESPVYVGLGGTAIIKAAIRSMKTDGSGTLNGISRIEIIDRDSSLSVYTDTKDHESSDDLEDFKFRIDLSSLISQAGTRKFRMTATDEEGNTGSKNFQITAVDVTCTCIQTLNYSASSIIPQGGSKTIDLYKFGNYTSDKGILVTTDIFVGGEWVNVGKATVYDAYSHAVSFDAVALGLSHGSYLVRIQGEDVSSGVKGNTIYTSVMVIDPESIIPVVSIRYNDTTDGEVKRYSSVKIEIAAYQNDKNYVEGVSLMEGEKAISNITCEKGTTYTVTRQIQSGEDGSILAFYAMVAGSVSGTVRMTVNGSAIKATLKENAIYAFDFGSRSNSESDHSITDGDFKMELTGVNWSSNGFKNYLGEVALRIAENVKGQLNHYPFKADNLESAGAAIQFAFASNNTINDDTMLLKCYDEGLGAGFYVTGKVIGIYANGGISGREERAYAQGEKVTVCVVVEPGSKTVSRDGTTYSTIKLYLNGEEVACIGYQPGGGRLYQEKPIEYDGTEGDLYLYYILAWESYAEWAKCFENHVVKLTDTAVMAQEYEENDVLTAQMPDRTKLADLGMPYIIECPCEGSNVGDLDNTTSTSTKNYITLYYYNPARPWTNFMATEVQTRNQGTTSAKRPVKNKRYYLAKSKGKNKNTVITLLNPDETTEEGRRAIELAKINKVQVGENTIPVDLITVKVDYSDSGNANDCGVCDMMNNTFRALGGQYLTPAQRAFDGTYDKGDVHLEGLQMNHSTANHNVATFRCDNEVPSSGNIIFHAKGNWKEDKSEQLALGFKDTPGYNKGCLNYGDGSFVEYFGRRDESLVDIKTRFRNDSTVNTGKLYLLSLYCGSSYCFMKYDATRSVWEEQGGKMYQDNNGKWHVEGTVLNPVTGFELLNYQGFDWFQGVSSLDDMMNPLITVDAEGNETVSTSSWVRKLVDAGSITDLSVVPAWTFYFECLVDDDDLALAYALGKKCPYELYRWLRFCDSCDYSKVPEAVWKAKWYSELYKYASPQSVMAYDVFTDYLAAVDQRAKNTQPMWFLDDGGKVENGIYNSDENVRMYLNKVYDCDTTNSKDNDGGCTVDAEMDPNRDTDENYTNPYAGWGSVLFQNIYHQQNVKCPTQESGELSLMNVASAMRSVQTSVDGVTLQPFSPEGAKYFFITKRLKKWPKVVSSYDGERKYINFTATADAIYFYALQGLGLTALPSFIQRRWRIRDGFYGTGSFTDTYISFRLAARSGGYLRIKAAKTGYFGIGNDNRGVIRESCYLEAGETHDFNMAVYDSNALIYIYQCDRISAMDMSQVTMANSGGTLNLGSMTLLEELTLGGTWHAEAANETSYPYITGLACGDMPFLRMINAENTKVETISAASCPRLAEVYAKGSALTTIALAETSPIETLELPSTMTSLSFTNLANLKYPGGLSFEGVGSVRSILVSDCGKMDCAHLLLDIIAGGASIRYIRLANINVTGQSGVLQTLIDGGVTGLSASGATYGESGKCTGLTGRWIMTDFVSNETLSSMRSYFPELSIHNSQYSCISFADTVGDPQNITNLDNSTGYEFGNNYTPSSHISQIWENMKPVIGLYSPGEEKMCCVRLDERDYTKLADGRALNNTYDKGEYDAFMYNPHYWYKGINDFKNDKKYLFLSSLDEEPISSASVVRRFKLSEILLKAGYSVITDSTDTGIFTEDGELKFDSSQAFIRTNSGYNTYMMDVEGMKQVRWPGVASSRIGAIFVDEDGKMLDVYTLTGMAADSDFTDGDYTFTNVPTGAKYIVFAAKVGFTNAEAIAVDSSELEAIEPDWVEHKPDLCGIYAAAMVNGTLRSVSGVQAKVGDGNSNTYTGWSYDKEGHVLPKDPADVADLPLHYTVKDFQNLAWLRGKGYQMIDYEMSKDIANLFFAIVGNRDGQAVCGQGRSVGSSSSNGWRNNYNTGAFDSIGKANSAWTSGSGNKVLGIENFMACNSEPMDNVAVNIADYATYKKNKMVPTGADPTDAVWHIFDPLTKTERTVQGLNVPSGYCIGRVKFGRFADVVPSKTTNDNSRWNQNYADGYWYAHQTGRAVYRCNINAYASGGLVFSSANYASSSSSTYYGARLAFRGTIELI